MNRKDEITSRIIGLQALLLKERIELDKARIEELKEHFHLEQQAFLYEAVTNGCGSRYPGLY